MTDPRLVVRSVLVYACCIPLAILLGYILGNQLSYTSLVTLGLVLSFLLLPVLLRWHYAILILSWNTIAVLPFIPGRPQLRLLLVGVSLTISWLVYALDRRRSPLNVRSISLPLLALLGPSLQQWPSPAVRVSDHLVGARVGRDDT